MKTFKVVTRAILPAILGITLGAGCATPPPPAAETPAPAAPAPAAAVSADPSLLPRVMILIDEKSLGTIATSEVESMAADKLIARSVPVVDQDMVRANLARQQQLLKAAGDNKGAAAIGTQLGADVVIVGEAVAKPSARRIEDTNLRTYQAVATLRAVRTDNSATIASVSEDATVAALEDVSGSAKALRAAAEKSLGRLIPSLLSAWKPGTPAAAAGHRIEITVGGVDQLWKLKAVRDRLRNTPDAIRNVVQRSYTSGVAVFSVESAKPAEELAEDLVLQPPEGLKLQVLDTAAGALQIKAVTPQG